MGSSHLIKETLQLNIPDGLFGTNPQCDSLDENFQSIVGRFPNNDYVFYSGQATLIENTVENPLLDGGLAAVNSGARLCTTSAKTFLNIQSCVLNPDDACQSTANGRNQYDLEPTIVKNAVVCGSEGEVESDNNIDPSEPKFFLYGHNHNLVASGLHLQTRAVAYTIFFNAKDQLRQRIAFALSQILVITPNQIDSDDREVEIFLQFYDIFVRHAFGNYKDILKEVAYSPMMAEMLSFLDSSSASYVLLREGRVSRPDENFAREIMQLFTIGLVELNIDGTSILINEEPIPTYENSDIQTFARAWTGFRQQYSRFNREGYYWMPNRVDPMVLEGNRRDPFPKMDLNQGFIEKHFLHYGATYRLIGSALRAEMEYERPGHNYTNVERFRLETNSMLYQKLCNSDEPGGDCNYRPLISLDENLDCYNKECEVDNISVIIVEDNMHGVVKYEYVRTACVEHAFYNEQNLNKVVDRYRKAMCLNKDINDVAMPSCCLTSDPEHWLYRKADYYCDFSFERTSYTTSRSRCQSINIQNFNNPDTCNWRYMRSWESNQNDRVGCFSWYPDTDFSWHWTNQACSMMVKVNTNGLVNIIHDPNLDINTELITLNETPQSVYQPVSFYNTNYFKVKWQGSGDFPKIANHCANNACQTIGTDCLCSIQVNEEMVFSSLPSAEEVIAALKVGHLPPESYDAGTYSLQHNASGVETYQKNDEALFSKETLFGVIYQGKVTFFKNIQSIVEITGNTGGVTYEFCNPPQFLNITKPDTRDATYETEAVLDHYFWHPNTAPFLATRLIQRFGISNPTPRYVKAVALAFKEGQVTIGEVIFGDGTYGSLEATMAAIIFDREARSLELDADPSFGSLREPLLKVILFMRAMEYTRASNVPSVMMDRLQDSIGQEIHQTPNVFSFFLPDFSPPGKISEAGLTAPEAQVLDSPKIVGILNGLFLLIDVGMTNCFGGFGDRNTWGCDGYSYFSPDAILSRGFLEYTPSDHSNGSQVIEDMSLLLSGGRLNSHTKSILVDAYNQELLSTGADNALKVVQKLMISIPEFHSTNVFESINTTRAETPLPQPSNTPYKAIVYLNLDGGLDSFNTLVPHPNCQGDTDQYSFFDEYTNVRGDIALAKESLLTIDASSSGQVCNTFGLHENLPFIKSLYDSNDLSFLANVGVLQQHVTKSNWIEGHSDTLLFSHNTQQDKINVIDIFDEEAGSGVCGRILNVLALNGYKPGAVSSNGSASTLRSNTLSTVVVDASGYQEFNPTAFLTSDILNKVKEINPASSIGSSLYGETWSNAFFQSLAENDMMYEELESTFLNVTFPITDLGMQLSSVAKVMKTKDARGTDRDIFNVRIGDFDHHKQIEAPLRERLETINDALEAFVTEIRDFQGIWDDVTVVVVSEFARTLMANTGNGSDHAWGGNYFVASGSLDGGRILGKLPLIDHLSLYSYQYPYRERTRINDSPNILWTTSGSFPSNLTNDGPFAFEPGIFIPSSPWESLWNGIAQWFGISSENDLTTVLPNRNTFLNDLWTKSDLFTGASPTTSPPVAFTPSPVASTPTPLASTPVPSKPDTPAPIASTPAPVTSTPVPSSTSSTCHDTTLRLKVLWNERLIMRGCTWVANKATIQRCSIEGVSAACRDTCSTCSTCEDTTLRFKVEWNGRKITSDCDWIGNRATIQRCNIEGVAQACPVTCGVCSSAHF